MKKKKRNTNFEVGITPHYVASNEERAQGLTRGAEAIKRHGEADPYDGRGLWGVTRNIMQHKVYKISNRGVRKFI